MGLACDVYTKLLFHRGHGYPLWEPEPTKAGEVLIGDVGYVLEGSFYRLFNATLPPDHAIHQKCGVPDGHEPFIYPDTLIHRRAHALQPGPICSTSVVAKSVEASVGVGMGNPGVVGELRFRCADEQGAVLVLKEDGAREALHPSKDLVQYIVRNHESWHRFAVDVFRLDLNDSDILFVSGCIKTGAWALAAATHRAREGELVFGGTFGALSQATFSVAAEEKITMSVEHRCGPKLPRDDAEAKRDQCVFLHYYKLKRRRVLGPKVIRAASVEPSLGRPPSPDDFADVSCDTSSGSLETAPGPAEFHDPVDSVLEYILDNTDASCAIASDQHLQVIYQSDPDHMSDDVYETLARIRPTISVIDDGTVGMLQTDGPYAALPTIHEDAMTDRAEAGCSAEATDTPIPLTPTNSTSTPPHLRNQGRRVKSLTHRRQRAHSGKRRSCTPTPDPVHVASCEPAARAYPSGEQPLDSDTQSDQAALIESIAVSKRMARRAPSLPPITGFFSRKEAVMRTGSGTMGAEASAGSAAVGTSSPEPLQSQCWRPGSGAKPPQPELGTESGEGVCTTLSVVRKKRGREDGSHDPTASPEGQPDNKRRKA